MTETIRTGPDDLSRGLEGIEMGPFDKLDITRVADGYVIRITRG